MKRKILITGASGGIGRVTALRFAEAGATIGVHYFSNAQSAHALCAELNERGARAVALPGDLAKAAGCENVVNTFVEQAGGLDVLVNNAGAMLRRGSFEDLSWEHIEETLRLNLTSVIYLCKLCAPHLRRSECGAIVNVGSIAGRTGTPAALPYAAAKDGVHCITRGLAHELAPRVRVNCVAPGSIATPFHEGLADEAMFAKWREKIPQRRLGTAEEIAAAIYFLAGPQASFITGETLDVNGGASMC